MKVWVVIDTKYDPHPEPPAFVALTKEAAEKKSREFYDNYCKREKSFPKSIPSWQEWNARWIVIYEVEVLE